MIAGWSMTDFDGVRHILLTSNVHNKVKQFNRQQNEATWSGEAIDHVEHFGKTKGSRMVIITIREPFRQFLYIKN